jgi:two-component system, cell cycle response regulator DivK
MIRVLYVEDEMINALVMKKFLEKEFDIQLASNAIECRKSLSESLPHVVLMDINLGNNSIDGIELFREIRNDPTMSHIPIFAVTAFAMPGDRERYLDIGFTDYFSKPVNRSQILERIRSIVGI